MTRLPLAWLQLTHEKLRLMAALAGIAFAVILMFVQLGLSAALFDAAVSLFSKMKADLFVVNRQYEYVIQAKTMPRERLSQTLAIEGVESATGIYLGVGSWKEPVKHQEAVLIVTGFDPRSHVVAIPEVEEKLSEVAKPDVVLFDIRSNPIYGNIADLYHSTPSLFTEVNRRRVRVGGLFSIGTGFAAPGNVFTSDTNFIRLFPNRSQDKVDVGLVRLKPGANANEIRTRLAAALPADVRVMTRAEFMANEKMFWDKVSPVGFIFGMGTLMGFVVGAVVVYQILYTDVSDHLPQYATLKAMGYGNGYLFLVVFKEAILLSLLGYIPGLVITQALYVITRENTGLPIGMTFERALGVFVITVVMCSTSGALAMRRLRSADPAEIF
jgi:putative ABC transport system permease protein